LNCLRHDPTAVITCILVYFIVYHELFGLRIYYIFIFEILL
jgi:hypothetical protein